MAALSDRTALRLGVGAAILVVALYLLNPLGVPSLDPRLRLLGIGVFRIPSRAMEPTMKMNTIFIASAWTYVLHSPRIGDVAVFRYPPDPSVVFAKRIIALGGDRVSIAGCVAVVNGTRLVEPYIAPVQHPDSETCNAASLVVPRSHFYVLGDARENSSDSRFWGFVPSANIIGRAVGY